MARTPAEIGAHFKTRSEHVADANTVILWHMNGSAGSSQKADNSQGDSAFDLIEHNAPEAIGGFNECERGAIARKTILASDDPPILAYPNPFRYTMTTRVSVPQAGHTELRIYDVRGRLVRTLLDQAMPSGRYDLPWNGDDDHGEPAPAGVYFIRLSGGKGVSAQKVVKVHR